MRRISWQKGKWLIGKSINMSLFLFCDQYYVGVLHENSWLECLKLIKVYYVLIFGQIRIYSEGLFWLFNTFETDALIFNSSFCNFLMLFSTWSQDSCYSSRHCIWIQSKKKVGETLQLASFVPLQFSSVALSCLTLCDPMNRSKPGLLVHHQLLEFT